jgi:hypothetical protein
MQSDNIMKYILIIGSFFILIGILYSSMNNMKSQKTSKPHGSNYYLAGYKSKWLFTLNEKDEYCKIKNITDELGLYLFAKVRLFDLIEPRPGLTDKKAYQFKIQSKHADFVICDSKLVARVVIECDDSSQDTKERAERDKFVDTVLFNCGYKVLHIRSIEPDMLRDKLKSIFDYDVR